MLAKIIFPVLLCAAFLLLYCDMDTLRIAIGLAAFYTLLSRLFARVFSKELVLGYPKWSYYLSMLQQAVILPPIAMLLVYEHKDCFREWLFAVFEYQGRYEAKSDIIKTLSLISTGSAMLKDFWIYGNRNELGFIIHHITTVFACGHCLAMPIYPGAVCLSGIFAESTSFFYNLNILYPSELCKYLQTLFIGSSNIIAMGVCWCMWTQVTEPQYLFWKIGFSLVVAVLVTLRFSSIAALHAKNSKFSLL